MGTLWRARRWRQLLNFIDRLPRHSAYHEALANDEQLAELMLKGRGGDSGPPARPVRLMSEFTPEVELLSVLADRMAELIQTVAVTKGAKTRPVAHQPRPTTAMQRVRARKFKQRHNSIVARIVVPD